jgi:fibronectin type 3 domain-containing protein
MYLRVKTIAMLLFIAILSSLMPASIASAKPVATVCDWAQFISDVTVPDGTTFAPNATFMKTWRLKNIGACTWTTSYTLVFDSGTQMGALSSLYFPINVAPGQTVDLSVNMTAPSTAGHYFGYWKLRNASYAIFGIGTTANKAFWVEINVSGTTVTGTGFDFTANAASAAWSSGAGSLSFPGVDGSSSGFALRKDRPRFESGFESSQPGLLFAPNYVTNGYIQAVYPALYVQTGSRFQAQIGCEYGATSCYVSYRLDYQIGSGTVHTFWTFREKYEGLTYNVDLNLNSLAGQNVKFILVVSAYGSPSGDRALWGNPILTGTTQPPPIPYSYDFGTASSPLASGYTRVTETTGYSAGGYGWTDISSLSSRDRGAPADALRQDFVQNDVSSARTFRVDLPNGGYSVNITMGDYSYVHDNMVVKANGTTMLSDVDTSAGSFAVNTFFVTVSGGYLALEFSDNDGSDPTWVVNAVTINPSSIPYTCDRAQFISDVTIPDGTIIVPGATFSKTWRLKNIGTCTWTTSYALMFDSGTQMGGPSTASMPTTVAPGQTVDITISLTAPTTAGTYRGYWKFRNASGIPFGIGTGGTKSWWVEIRVTYSTATTPMTPGTPIAGSMYDFAANYCSANWYSGAGSLPCPGMEGDSRGFVININNPHLENGTYDSRPGLLTFPQNTYNGYIQGIYPVYHVNAGDHFRSIVNCESGATSCYVVFRLDYLLSGSSTISVFWAFVEKYEGLYYQADIDLSPLVGQNVRFVLTVLSTGSPTGDRALWVAPIIYNSTGVSSPTATNTLPVTLTPSPSPTATLTPTLTLTPTATTTPVVSYKFDFGTSTSALASGYTRISEATTYAAGVPGWTDTSSLSSRDRGAPADAVKQDFVQNDASTARIFKVDLANGTYNVTVTMGDNDYAHDNMVVKANGTTALADVDSAAGGFAVNSFPVTVSGGSLSLEFSDAGGTDPTWIVNGVVINSTP